MVFFYMNDDLILALWPTASLSRDAKIAATQSSSARSSSDISSTRGKRLILLFAAGGAGRCCGYRPPHDRFWGGYSGFFRDPDDHLWDILWNAQWSVPD